MPSFRDITGKSFPTKKGSQTALRYLGDSKWLVRCDQCGNETIKVTSQITSGNGCKKCMAAKVNKGYFRDIDSPEKAYWLGFLWADGYCTDAEPEPRMKIDLKESDFEHLEKMKAAFEYTGRITSYVAKKGHSYRPDDALVYRLCVTDRDFVANLINIGLIPHRERALMPNAVTCDENLLKAFVSGYFDGNGCAGLDQKGKTFPLQICGGTNLVRQIGEYLTNSGYSIKYYQRCPENPDNTSLMMCKRSDQARFMREVYIPSPVHLNRKLAKAESILSIR